MDKAIAALGATCAVGGCLGVLLYAVLFNLAAGALIYFTWGLYDAPTLVKIGLSVLIYLVLGALIGKVRPNG